MAIAETAQLAVELNLGGNFTGGMAAAEGELAGFNTTAAKGVSSAGLVEGAFGRVKGAAQGIGGALSHAGGQLKGILTGPIGFLGLTGGLLSVGGALEEGISRAQDWGATIEKLAPLTHDTTEQLSGLLAITDRYNISGDKLVSIAGFTTKAIGNIATKGADAAKSFRDQYGFAITDAHGRTKDFYTLLTDFSDYWNNTAISQPTKAAAAAKVFGRGYSTLIPIFALGKKGIEDAEQAAKDFGLTLTDQNVRDLAAARTATRDWGDALHGLELQIGVALLPELTDLAKNAASFVKDHRTDIVSFFRNAADAARTVAGDIGDVASAAVGFWNKIPPELRDWLIKGVVADRTFKFLFGVDPAKLILNIGVNAVEGIAGGLGSALVKAGIGKAFVQPVFVTNPGFGGGGGGANPVNVAEDVGAGAAAGEGAGALAGAAGAGTLGALGAGLIGAAIAPYVIAALLPRNPANFTPNPTASRYTPSRPSFGMPTSQVVFPAVQKVNVAEIDAGAWRNADRDAVLANERTADHVEALRQTLGGLQADSNRIEAGILAKRESNRISVVNRIGIVIPVSASSGAGTTVRKFVSTSSGDMTVRSES